MAKMPLWRKQLAGVREFCTREWPARGNTWQDGYHSALDDVLETMDRIRREHREGDDAQS